MSWISLVTSFIVVNMLLLDSYRSVIPSVGMGSFLFVVWTFLLFLLNKKVYIKKGGVCLLYIAVGTLINVICSLFFEDVDLYIDIFNILFRMIKFVMVLWVYCFTDLWKCDSSYYFKCLRITIWINSIMIVIQQAMYIIFSIELRNPMQQFFVGQGYISASMRVGNIFRPAGLFQEPSHAAEFMVPFMCVLLFIDNRQYFIDIWVAAIGVFATGSGIGIFLVCGLLICFMLKNNRNNVITSMAIFMGFLWGILSFRKTVFISTVLDRITTTKYGGNAIAARIGNGYNLFGELNLLRKICGCGYGNVPLGEYLNGVTFILNTIGIVGACIVIGIIYKIYVGTIIFAQKILILVFVIVCAVAQIFTGNDIIYYLCLLECCVFLKQKTVANSHNIMGNMNE